VTLGTEVVDLVGSDLMQVPDERGRVGEVRVVEGEAGGRLAGVPAEVVDSIRPVVKELERRMSP